MKVIFIKTFGCQMNVRDSEVISGLLKKSGFGIIDSPEKADVVIFNTCSVRKGAEDRVFSQVGIIEKLGVKSKKKKIIGLVGCMAQNFKENIFKKAPSVDFVAGPQDIHKIPEIIKKLLADKLFERKIWETDSALRPEDIYHSGYRADKTHAYVVISEGCSNFCSYCVVPYVRGPLRHRKHGQIIREIEEAVLSGITGITLLGQNVSAYKDEEVDFVKLLELVGSVKGLKEFAFMTSHPRDTTKELFKAIAGIDKLKKELHLPIQSGSDRILKLMNRGYNRKFYLDLANVYRKIVKGGLISTDIIVGFPSESAVDFKETKDLLQKVEFNSAYIFKYSQRPGTEAARMNDDVPGVEKEKRHKIILDLQRKISKKKK